MESGGDRPAGGAVVEVEFAIEDGRYPFVAVTDGEACRFDLVEMVPRDDGCYAEFFDVTGADPARILDVCGAFDGASVYLLREYDSGGLFEFLVSGKCPAVTLAELGALPREVRGRNGIGRIRAEIPSRYEPAAVIESFLAATPEAELVRKRETEAITPMFSNDGFREVVSANLTDRQCEVLRAAFDAGYYDWPRESTGSDVADELGITSATFSQHIHAAERSLLAVLFDANP